MNIHRLTAILPTFVSPEQIRTFEASTYLVVLCGNGYQDIIGDPSGPARRKEEPTQIQLF